jgi:hypothetical protein
MRGAGSQRARLCSVRDGEGERTLVSTPLVLCVLRERIAIGMAPRRLPRAPQDFLRFSWSSALRGPVACVSRGDLSII